MTGSEGPAQAPRAQLTLLDGSTRALRGDGERAAVIHEHRVRYPVGLDPDLRLFRAYAVSEPPLVALVSPSGELVRGWPGGVDMATLTKAVEALP